MKNMHILLIILVFTLCGNAMGEIQGYESSDNTGLNKKERIDSIEKYLIDLSTSLKKMEAKFDEHAKKIIALEDVVKKLNERNQAQTANQLGEKKPESTGDQKEMDKLKADILSLKNKDIEKLKTDIEDLTNVVKSLQLIIRSQN